MNSRRSAIIGIGIAALGVLAARQTKIRQAESSRPATRYPNISLTTHEGKTVRFYDDLIHGKVVAVNMMYTQCEGICPITAANIRRVQKLLGNRAGRDVHLYSLTLKPEIDTPAMLKHYAHQHGVGPGWQLLTGTPDDVKQLRIALGFFDPDPSVDADTSTHTGVIRIGNANFDRWTMAPGLADPEQILATINHVDRRIVHTHA